MGKLQTFAIVYDQPNTVYFPNQNVSGRIIVVLNEAMKMRKIELKIVGEAATHWTETESHSYTDSQGHTRTRHETIHYYANERCMHYQLNLPGLEAFIPKPGDDPVMPPGTHTYPFSITLPPNCFPSFEGAWGSVRYYCKATIDRPWRFDHTVKEMFTVLPIIDLNLSPGLRLALVAEETGSPECCCSCDQGTMTVKIQTPKGGYVAGEVIDVAVAIANNSNETANSIRAQLNQVCTFRADRHGSGMRHTREDKRLLFTDTQPAPTKQGESSGYKIFRMGIPAVVPSFSNCSIIDVSYRVKVTIEVEGTCTSNIDAYLPVVVGSIPIILASAPPPPPGEDGGGKWPQPSDGGWQPPSVQPTAPTDEKGAMIDGAAGGHGQPPPPMYPNLPPPTYEDCVFGKVTARDGDDNEHTRGNAEYAPKYPMYHGLPEDPPPPPQQ